MKYKIISWTDCDCENCGVSNFVDKNEENFECGECHEVTDIKQND